MLIDFCHRGDDVYCIYDCEVKINTTYDKLLKELDLENVKVYNLVKISENPVKSNNEYAEMHVKSNISSCFVCFEADTDNMIFLIMRESKSKKEKKYKILHEIGHIKCPPQIKVDENDKKTIMKFNIENERNADIFVLNYLIDTKQNQMVDWLIAKTIKSIRYYEEKDDKSIHQNNYYLSALCFLHQYILNRKNYSFQDHYLNLNKFENVKEIS